ncbi:uncharacterized protein Aud_009279 [Aspergillus udagawae]|uniref:Uncharacterized protein n=1 Tax=Aspergillus udagawae TaxID=91492 RepID=A0A8E0R1N2_9EURO|nr:uncharacterized protein Aud_009279 [Aspergillus udagawae]GIC92806.1 hypothetical protein Aud_009279 [Aspergillus udagawae]
MVASEDMDKGGVYSTVPLAPDRGAKRMQGRIQEILIAFTVMTLPMLIFSGLLLGLVFHYRITQNDFSSSDLAFDSTQNDPNVYFVRISATTLTTVASWSSTIAPILVGFGVALVSYPVAKGLLTASENHEVAQLPTPFQLSLIVRMISSGSFSALWSWLMYSFGWRGRRERQVRALKSLTTVLILGIVSSTVVLVTDTWLHFTTKTVNFIQVNANSDASGLGFGVYQNCTNVDSTLLSCNLNNPASGNILLNPDPMKVLSNISDTMTIRIYSAGQDQYAYIASPETSRLSLLDYTVSTYAIHSQCSPLTSQCANPNDVSGVHTTYNCPFEFQGAVNTAVGASNSVTMAYFTDSTGSNNNTDKTLIGNPYYYSAMILANMRNARPAALQNDPEVLSGGHGGATIVAVGCTSTVYDVEYSSVNSTIKNWKISNSNRSTTLIVQGTQRHTDVGNPNLIQAASIAGLGNSAQEIADQFALAYSQTALAVASGAFEPRAALASQVRERILVARVPKAPLFALIAANLLLVFLGIILAIVALIAVRDNTGEAQARLSIPAIVAALFEVRMARPVNEVEDMFEERHGERGPRIGFAKAVEGGWVFQSWRPN